MPAWLVAAKMAGCVVALALTVDCSRPSGRSSPHGIQPQLKTPAFATLPQQQLETPIFYKGEGKVLRVDVKEAKVTIAHKEIAGFMPAMIMTFKVENGARLAGLKAGDRVKFTLKSTAASARLTAIQKQP